MIDSERGRSALAELREVPTVCRLPEGTAMAHPGTCKSAGKYYGKLIVCCLIYSLGIGTCAVGIALFTYPFRIHLFG